MTHLIWLGQHIAATDLLKQLRQLLWCARCDLLNVTLQQEQTGCRSNLQYNHQNGCQGWHGGRLEAENSDTHRCNVSCVCSIAEAALILWPVLHPEPSCMVQNSSLVCTCDLLLQSCGVGLSA